MTIDRRRFLLTAAALASAPAVHLGATEPDGCCRVPSGPISRPSPAKRISTPHPFTR
jgi:hypothetical protein